MIITYRASFERHDEHVSRDLETTTTKGEDMSVNDTTRATQKIGKAGLAVKRGVIRSLNGIDEIEAEIVSLVRTIVSDALHATSFVEGESVGIIKDIVTGSIQAAEEFDAGLILSIKGVVKGIVMGASDVDGDLVDDGRRHLYRRRERDGSVRVIRQWRGGAVGAVGPAL
jgi:hypothetical protein